MKFYNSNLFFVSILQFLLSLTAFNNDQSNFLFVNLIIYWIFLWAYAYREKQKTIIFFFFLSTFFVYLLGRDILINIFNFEVPITNNFSNGITSHVYFSLHLSLFFIYIGFVLFNGNRHKEYVIVNNYKNELTQKICKKIFYYTLPFKLLLIAIDAYNFTHFAYADVYANKLSSLYIFDRFDKIEAYFI